MKVSTFTTWNEHGVGTSQQGPGSGFRPRIGVRGKLSAGMTGGGDAVSGTGNHKGCPYDGLAGVYFRNNPSCRLPPTPPIMKMAVGAIRESPLREIGQGLFSEE